MQQKDSHMTPRTVSAIATTTAVATLISLASVTGAHSDASNPAVQARMDVMKTIAAQTRTLGNMAQGKVEFDAEAAKTAATTLASAAAQVPEVFEAPEDDPESEAKPIIWEQWDDFTAKAMMLETAATDAAGSITDVASIGAAMGAIGGSCKACHSTYRE